jgi:D-alanyl-D-alanine carboxypeptidase
MTFTLRKGEWFRRGGPVPIAAPQWRPKTMFQRNILARASHAAGNPRVNRKVNAPLARSTGLRTMHAGAGWRGALVTIAVMLCFMAGGASAARADSRHAAIVMDANTGRVLHAANADARRFPASLTKLMTLYLVFEQMEAGRLHATTPIRVSAQAASVPPSKLGL